MTLSGAWLALTFDGDSSLPKQNDSAWEAFGSSGICLLLRSQENYLQKFLKDEDTSLDRATRVELSQEVRALCSQWLKMQNVCALIGAGASHYACGFVGRNLYERVAKILSKRDSARTLEAISQFVDKPDQLGVRFEDFLSQLAMLVRLFRGETGPLDKITKDWAVRGLGKSGAVAEKLSDLLSDIEHAITVLCSIQLPESELTLKGKGITPHETFLAKMVSRDPQQSRGRLFTTNYDTLLEQAMDRLGILYADGFTGTVERRFNPASYDLDVYYPGEITSGRVRRYDKVLHLYKIHGSVNWRRSAEQAGDPFGIHMAFQRLPTEEAILATPGLLDGVFPSTSAEQGREGLAILPTAAKFGETLAMPYAHLFRAMAQVLRENQTLCFVIGYSGWDQHINRIIEDSLTNPAFTCVLVNPTLTLWSKRLLAADYSGRVYAFAGEWARFEFFAEEIMPDLEILKSDLAIAKTIRDLQTVAERHE